MVERFRWPWMRNPPLRDWVSGLFLLTWTLSILTVTSWNFLWVRSVKEECLSRLIVFGESSQRRALQQYIVHYHEEHNHQGKDNRILFHSRPEAKGNMGAVRCRERLEAC